MNDCSEQKLSQEGPNWCLIAYFVMILVFGGVALGCLFSGFTGCTKEEVPASTKEVAP